MSSLQTPAELGAALNAQRKALGITQDELAGIVGVNRRVIGELERGKGTVRLAIALATARALGLDVELRARSG
jgi:HTH-type transcriptional regulator / antitoxin HipB